MPVKVSVNKMTVVHASSNGVTVAFPDVCKTPAPPAPPLPIPYPNIAKSSDSANTTKTVTCDGNPVCVKDSNFMLSSGDEAGSLMGVASNKVKGKAEFVNFSFDVFFEGKNVPRALDPMLHNDKNTPPAPLMQPPLVAPPSNPKDQCSLCGEARGGAGGMGGGGAGGARGGSGTSDAGASATPSGSPGTGASGAPPASAPAASTGRALTQSRIVNVKWLAREAWCADRVSFSGDVDGGASAKIAATVTPAAGGTPQTISTRVFSSYHAGVWEVKDVPPPIVGGHAAKAAEMNVMVSGVSSPKALKVRFAPTVPLTSYAHGYHRFSLSAEDFTITLRTDVRYVKGWGAEVVKLGNHVPPGTGGLLDAEGFAYPGCRWTKVDAGGRKFWNGGAWESFPAGYVLVDADYFGVGIIKKGNDFVSVYGGKWPGTFQDWDTEAGPKAEKIRTWISEIEKTWTGKFDLKRSDCKSEDKSCCRYRVVVKASFTKVDAYGPGIIVLADKNIRSNTSLFFIDEPRIAMVAHEIGHYLGNPDEYAGARLDTTLNDDGAHAGIDMDSIMGQHMTVVKKRHFRTINRVFAEAVAREYSRTFNFEPVRS